MRSVFRYLAVLLLSLGAALTSASAFAQTGNSGTISGNVKDATGGVIGGASVEITNPVSGYKRYASTGADGSFKFTNVPFNPYHLVATAKGFAPYTEDVDLRSSVPVTLQIGMQVAGTSATVTRDMIPRGRGSSGPLKVGFTGKRKHEISMTAVLPFHIVSVSQNQEQPA